MIADLRGKSALFVAVRPPLAEAIDEAFARHGAACVRCDTADVEAALESLRGEGRTLEVLVIDGSSPAPAVASLDDYGAEALTHAVTAGAWPVFACLQRVRGVLGRFPRYAVALSSTAPNRFAGGADFCAASEAVLETLCRYVNERLSAEDFRMNVLRHRLRPEPETRGAGDLFATPQEVAGAALALCSGLLDSMRGQVLTVDRGASFSDNVFRRFEAHAALGK